MTKRQLRAALEVERAHRETRGERIRSLVEGNPMQHAERVLEAEYVEGWAHGLDWVLMLAGRPAAWPRTAGAAVLALALFAALLFGFVELMEWLPGSVPR